MTMTCPWCQGRGWQWRSSQIDNAERVPCMACKETGRGPVQWAIVWATVGILAGWVAIAGVILWLTTL